MSGRRGRALGLSRIVVCFLAMRGGKSSQQGEAITRSKRTGCAQVLRIRQGVAAHLRAIAARALDANRVHVAVDAYEFIPLASCDHLVAVLVVVLEGVQRAAAGSREA